MMVSKCITNIYSKLFCLYFGLFFSSINAQTTITVIDAETKERIAYPRMQTPKGEEISIGGMNGILVWNSDQHPKVRITGWNYHDTLINAEKNVYSDTVIIQLHPKPKLLNEVSLRSRRSWLSDKIYGFERWDQGWVFHKFRKLVVTDEQLNILYTVPLEKRVKHLLTDALGNIYLPEKDSVKQIQLTDTVMYTYPASVRKAYDNLVAPIALQTNNGMVYRDIEMNVVELNQLFRQSGMNYEFRVIHPPFHNCGVRYILVNNQSKKTIYQVIDSLSYTQASEKFGEYIAMYVQFYREMETTGKFDPKIKSKCDSIHHYYNVFEAKRKDAYWFAHQQNYILIDPFTSSYITFDQQFNLLTKEYIDLSNCPATNYFFIDKATGEWWLRRQKNGLETLHPIRPGTKRKPVEVDVFCENLRIFNDKVFYLKAPMQFRIKRLEM